jgi:hypothetical protein
VGVRGGRAQRRPCELQGRVEAAAREVCQQDAGRRAGWRGAEGACGGGKQPKESTPDGVGRCDRVGDQHQANLREMRELQRRKADEPRRPLSRP